jgi:site-specific DNA recombinase
LRWNSPDKWVWSDDVVHQPLIDTETFERAQHVIAAKGAGRKTWERRRTSHPYVLRGLLHCGLCGRRMQGQRSKEALYYRCRFATEYGLANKIAHPRNVYLAERDLLRPLDRWLATAFAPHRLAETIDALYQAQPSVDVDPAAAAAARVIEECDQKLARHRAALEAGADPQLVAGWISEVQARRAEALSRSRPVEPQPRMTREEIQSMVAALGDVRAVLADADPREKGDVYRRLGLRLTYRPGDRTVRAETSLDPHSWGYGSCPRGDLNPHPLLGD